MSILADVRFTCPTCGYTYSPEGMTPIEGRDLDAEMARVSEVGEQHRREVHGTGQHGSAASEPWHRAIEQAMLAETSLRRDLAKRLDALEKELRYAISCNKEAIERESAHRKDLRRVAGYLSEIARRVGVPAPRLCSDDAEDPKDALIRDLVTFAKTTPDTRIASEYLKWCDEVRSFGHRAEKLGVKL